MYSAAVGSRNITTSAAPSRIKILFLGANPSDTTRLALDREAREITHRLRATPRAERFELVHEWALRVGDMQAALLRHKPQVVHFSGHGRGSGRGSDRSADTTRDFLPDAEAPAGEDEGGILVEDDAGKAVPITASALAELFRIVGGVRCVVLNACHSAAQADTLRQHVDCVVGMGRAIHDHAAIAFAWAFYQGLGFGETIPKAFELGRNQIHLGGFADVDVPQLLLREAAQPSPILLDPTAPAESGGSLPRALDDEILILIAQFDGASSHRIHIEERIHRAFSRIGEVIPDIPWRIERLRDITIENGDERRATEVIAQCNARLLIWGWYDQVGFSPRLTADSSAAIEREIPAFDEVYRDDADAGFRKYVFSGLADNLRTWALSVSGELLYWSGKFDDCLKVMDVAIEQWRASRLSSDALLDARIASAFFYKGVLMGTRKGDVGAAAACFRQVLELKPNAFMAAYNLGDALYNLADYEGAVGAFTTVLDSIGPHYRSLVGRGHAYARRGRYREAVEDYSAALGLLMTADIFLARSMAYQALGSVRLAIGDYILAQKLDPYAHLQTDHLGSHLLRTRGKDAYEQAEFGAIPGASSEGRYKVPRVTQFLGTAKRFLGRTPPPLGTRGVVADPVANDIAAVLTRIDEGTGVLGEWVPSPAEFALHESGERFLEAFGNGFPDLRGALTTLVTMLRLGGPRGSLTELLEISEVRTRLQPRTLSAMEFLLRANHTYAHAAAIRGGDPVLWNGDEAKELPVCVELCGYLDALRAEELRKEDDYVEDWSDHFERIARPKDKAIHDLLFGLAPPEPRVGEGFRWDDLRSVGDAASLARDSATLSQRMGDLFRFLEENAMVPSDVRAVVVEILQGSRPFLLEAIHLRSGGARRRDPVDADGRLEVNGMAETMASLVSTSADTRLPEQTRAAASIVVGALMIQRMGAPRSWEPLPDLARACKLLKNKQATAGLFAAISGYAAMCSRLNSRMESPSMTGRPAIMVRSSTTKRSSTPIERGRALRRIASFVSHFVLKIFRAVWPGT